MLEIPWWRVVARCAVSEEVMVYEFVANCSAGVAESCVFSLAKDVATILSALNRPHWVRDGPMAAKSSKMRAGKPVATLNRTHWSARGVSAEAP